LCTSLGSRTGRSSDSTNAGDESDNESDELEHVVGCEIHLKETSRYPNAFIGTLFKSNGFVLEADELVYGMVCGTS